MISRWLSTCGPLDPGLATWDMVVLSQAMDREGLPTCPKGVEDDTGVVLSDPHLTALGRAAWER